MPIMLTRGEVMNFREPRILANMTQQAAASELGIERTTISMWETGAASPRSEMLLKIAALYKCSVDELLKEETA